MAVWFRIKGPLCGIMTKQLAFIVNEVIEDFMILREKQEKKTKILRNLPWQPHITNFSSLKNCKLVPKIVIRQTNQNHML